MTDRPVKIDLLSRPQCHLCDVAFDVLRELQEELGFRVVKVDISRNLEYLRLYRDHIPVALIDGQELFRHRITPEGLRELLSRRKNRSQGSTGDSIGSAGN